jgi:hypothetical protein
MANADSRKALGRGLSTLLPTNRPAPAPPAHCRSSNLIGASQDFRLATSIPIRCSLALSSRPIGSRNSPNPSVSTALSSP